MQFFSIVQWIVDLLGLPPSWAGPYLHVVMAIVSAVIITIISLIAYRSYRVVEARLIPESGITVAGILEVLVGAVLRLMEDVMGPKAKRHLPLVGSLFIYILISDLLGIIPGLFPPTENINTNFACAIVVFLYYNFVGIREQGFVKYFKHMAGPVIWLAPLIFCIELVSHLVRPVSLSVRLMGNIVGDHMVLGMFSNLTPVLIPIIFMGMGIFVSFMQAFVFTLLTIIYIQMAEASEEH